MLSSIIRPMETKEPQKSMAGFSNEPESPGLQGPIFLRGENVSFRECKLFYLLVSDIIYVFFSSTWGILMQFRWAAYL